MIIAKFRTSSIICYCSCSYRSILSLVQAIHFISSVLHAPEQTGQTCKTADKGAIEADVLVATMLDGR